MARVILTDPIDPVETERLKQHAEVDVVAPADKTSFRRAIADADVLIVRSRLDDDIFDHAPKLKAVIRHGSGVDIIPVAAASRQGIAVANVPGANARSVAEYCIAAIFDAARNIEGIHRHQATHGWSAARVLAGRTSEVAKRNLGIVGLGAIGRAVAAMGSALGMHVSAYGHRPDATAPKGVSLHTFEELLAGSDFLCLCCPLTDRTRNLVNAESLQQANGNLWLVNVARAAVVDQHALLHAVRSQAIGGATLDVFEPEVDFIAACATLPNIKLTPHLAGLPPESIQRMSVGAVDAAIAVFAGSLPPHMVNADTLNRGRLRLPQRS